MLLASQLTGLPLSQRSGVTTLPCLLCSVPLSFTSSDISLFVFSSSKCVTSGLCCGRARGRSGESLGASARPGRAAGARRADRRPAHSLRQLLVPSHLQQLIGLPPVDEASGLTAAQRLAAPRSLACSVGAVAWLVWVVRTVPRGDVSGVVVDFVAYLAEEGPLLGWDGWLRGHAL